MKINQVSKITGLSIDTIRYYEKMELINPKRSGGNYRDFSEEDIKQLTLITNFKLMHFTIIEMKAVLNLINQDTSLSCNVASIELLQEKITSVEQEIEMKRRNLNIFKELHDLVQGNQYDENEAEVHQLLLSLREGLEK